MIWKTTKMKHMKKVFFSILTFSFLSAGAQENVLPAPKQKQPIAITGATVHVGNGQVLEQATVIMVDGKITAVGTNVTIPAGAQKIDATGKQTANGVILEKQSDVTAYLLNEAKLAIVPFYAFGSPHSSAWYRLSVGTVKIEELHEMFAQFRQALKGLS